MAVYYKINRLKNLSGGTLNLAHHQGGQGGPIYTIENGKATNHFNLKIPHQRQENGDWFWIKPSTGKVWTMIELWQTGFETLAFEQPEEKAGGCE